MAPEFTFDAASAIDKGQRRYQEDAVISSFAEDQSAGLVVLSDGMGGHAAGDIASQIVVTEFHRAWSQARAQSPDAATDVAQSLRQAAYASNTCLKEHVAQHPSTKGMGATLLATFVLNGSLYWLSIGDSPLFLYRDGDLIQLNEDHSLSPQVDFMVSAGLLTEDEATRHPDRNVLTSALLGEDIPKIDCPQMPTSLQDGDVLVCASDGLQFLPNHQIENILRTCDAQNSDLITRALMSGVLELGDASQDNITVSVIKAQQLAPVPVGPELNQTVTEDCATGYI